MSVSPWGSGASCIGTDIPCNRYCQDRTKGMVGAKVVVARDGGGE